MFTGHAGNGAWYVLFITTLTAIHHHYRSRPKIQITICRLRSTYTTPEACYLLGRASLRDWLFYLPYPA